MGTRIFLDPREMEGTKERSALDLIGHHLDQAGTTQVHVLAPAGDASFMHFETRLLSALKAPGRPITFHTPLKKGDLTSSGILYHMTNLLLDISNDRAVIVLASHAAVREHTKNIVTFKSDDVVVWDQAKGCSTPMPVVLCEGSKPTT